MITALDPFLLFSPDAPNYPFGGALDAKLDEIQADIESAILLGKGAGLEVFVATYFFLPRGSLDCDPLFLEILLPAQADVANAYVTRLNQRIRRAARNQSATIVDVATKDVELRGNSANYFNCNHLSASGNDIVARLFADAIGG